MWIKRIVFHQNFITKEMEKNQQDRKNPKSRSNGSKIIHDPRGARKNLEEEEDSPVRPRRSSAEGDPNEKTTGYSSEGEE